MGEEAVDGRHDSRKKTEVLETTCYDGQDGQILANTGCPVKFELQVKRK